MTFTTMLKEELSKFELNNLEKRAETLAYLRLIGKFNSSIIVTSENASVIRKIYLNLKEVYGVQPKIMIRIQKRFRIKQIYILEIKEKIDHIKSDLNYDNIKDASSEEKTAFLEGAFLAVGTISDPKTSGYHLEFPCLNEIDANFIMQLLEDFNFNAKVIKRDSKYVTYLKSSEEISDLIKMFKAINSLFYFEDIRIYRDHKNMVNRLNNCEIANQEKTIQTGLKQLNDIQYLKDNDLMLLLDEKTKILINMREKYPESSYVELANIISLETKYKIGKSGINHQFIKINEMINKHKKVGSINE